jgi:hypothetical protein
MAQNLHPKRRPQLTGKYDSTRALSTMSTAMSADKSINETLRDAIFDEDKRLGEEVPGAPFVVVGLSYVAILGVVGIATVAAMWWLN